MMEYNQNIKDFPKIIIGEPLKKIGRCVNLVWFIFNTEEKYSLHIQCAWRLLKNGIIVASRDIYVPNDLEYSDDFEWDRIGSTLFDTKAGELNVSANEIVKDVEINALGDIQLIFPNMTLQTFVDNSANEEEQWRFFQKGGDRHMVARSNRIEWE